VLAALHPAERNPDRLSNYKPYENSLDISGLTFPLAVKDVPKFEKQNLTISVNVLCRGDEGGFVPLHVSKERDRPHHVNLFLIEGEDENRHYVWVKKSFPFGARQNKRSLCSLRLQPLFTPIPQ